MVPLKLDHKQTYTFDESGVVMAVPDTRSSVRLTTPYDLGDSHRSNQNRQESAASSVVGSQNPADIRAAINQLVSCPHCGKAVRENDLYAHLSAFHMRSKSSRKAISPSTPQKPARTTSVSFPRQKMMVQCSQCPSMVRSDRMEKHLLRIHHLSQYQVRSGFPVQQRATASASVKPNSKVVSNKRDVPKSPLPAAFAQSHDEKMYGDKYLGQMRRESDGKFGSLPLYDDYSDEANAD